jgi:hypothetical protein
LRYYGNATGCIGHATKGTQHVTIYTKTFENFQRSKMCPYVLKAILNIAQKILTIFQFLFPKVFKYGNSPKIETMHKHFENLNREQIFFENNQNMPKKF